MPKPKSTQSKISVELSRPDAEKLAEALELQMEDEGCPLALFEVNEDENLWAVSAYCDTCDTPKFEEILISGLDGLKIKAKPTVEILPDTNWVTHNLRELAPVYAGRFVVHGTHDLGIASANKISVQIDAGQAFGTGHHGTTAGCLDMLHEISKRGRFRNTLDLGTGSGVLAIAQAKAFKTPVLASDIDPIATQVTLENSRLNGVHGLVDCVTSNGFNHPSIQCGAPYDLIIANILARPLQKMARDFARHSTVGTKIILSGLLPHQRARICAAFRLQGFAFEKAHLREGWLTLVLSF